MLQLLVLRNGKWSYPFKAGDDKNLVTDFSTLFKQQASVLERFAPEDRKNIFFTIGHHMGIKGSLYPVRKHQSFDYQAQLPFDIDRADGGPPIEHHRYMDYLESIAEVMDVPVTSLCAMTSGNGIQVYIHLKVIITKVAYFKENKAAYNEICLKIKHSLAAKGLPVKMDTTIFEGARLMRMPGTINQKPDIPDTNAEQLQWSDVASDIDLQAISGLDKLKIENISPEQVRRQYSRPDFKEMADQCLFVKWCFEHREEVHEPDFFDLLSLLHAMPPSSKITLDGKEYSNIEIARYVHEGASASRSLARTDFESKWEAAGRYGARKCTTIGARWKLECVGCPHKDRIPTPLALKSKEHIGSKEMGYWILNAKGLPMRPHYGDLAKVYGGERTYITTQDTRIFSFDENKYTHTKSIELRAWLEKLVEPSDPLMDNHCNEFVKKIERVGFISPVTEKELFVDSLKGKLNCKNGVLDVVRGELIPHNPSYGFKYVLPYEYHPGEASEPFLDWLSTITQDRAELMESILDMMGYILWPDYDEHIFVYFVGEGGNGKSTFINIVKAMVGPENFSAINGKQLMGNRFMAANLEGKLVNLSEETSDYEISIEEMNTLKNLSAGGTSEVEKKGTQGYSYTNKAKLLFSANKMPRFKDQGEAVKRRFVAIPFDYQIVKADPGIEEMLISEVPKIMSMLVGRIQANIAKNGKYRINRGGHVADETRKRIFAAGNTVVEWAQEHIKSASDITSHIEVPAAYDHYIAWCDKNHHRNPQNNLRFGRSMYDFVVSTSVDRNDNRVTLNGKQIRVFKKTKYKEEV